jgi:formylglycine-generating enzyme required for sulfatase activity
MVRESGIAILDAPDRCKEALQHYSREGSKREIRLFLIGLEAGCHQALLESKDPEQTKHQLVKELQDEYGLTQAYAEEIVAILTAAIHTPERAEKAISSELEKAAKNGDPRAQYELGRVYESQGNYAEAVRWFNEASQQDIGSFEQALQDDLAPQEPQSQVKNEKQKRKTLPEHFIRIKSGSFIMGSPSTEARRQENELQHYVKLKAFCICKFAVTQEEYEKVMEANPSKFKGPRLPVDSVSWYDAVEYCNKRSLLDGLPPAYEIHKGRYDINNTNSFDKRKWQVALIEDAPGYRLPTESEWEYACRGGTKTPYHTGESISLSQANFTGKDEPSKLCTAKIGSYPPNPWGLHEMHGNVYEWCWDWYSILSEASLVDPLGAVSGSQRVLRGGSWNKSDDHLRSSARVASTPSLSSGEYGFRLAKNA